MDSAQQSTPANALDQRTCVLPEAVRVLDIIESLARPECG
jgi:hypothetical protein